MDLDDLQNGTPKVDFSVASSTHAPSDVLELVDRLWYAPLSRKSRYMDLIGDYAGNELFVLDGDSMIQRVLDDPLVAIAKEDDPSFQIAHARWNMESFLQNLRCRNANFDIVFWEEHRHPTIHRGSSHFQLASRSLARTILVQYACRLNIAVHRFTSLKDDRWIDYKNLHRPMFVMLNDGGLQNQDTSRYLSETLLLQRLVINDILLDGMAVALLEPIEFRDSKILSFIVEEQRQFGQQAQFGNALIECRTITEAQLVAYEKETLRPRPQAVDGVEKSLKNTLVAFAKLFSSRGIDCISRLLLKTFIAQCLVISNISLEARAQRSPIISEELKNMLLADFLPTALSVLHSLVSSGLPFPDLDNRLFLCILDVQIRNPEKQFFDIIGRQSNELLTDILGDADIVDVTSAEIANLCSLFAVGTAYPVHSSSRSDNITVLPFRNTIFDDILPIVKVDGNGEANDSRSSFFNYDAVYADEHHWHGQRTILPKHQGGADGKSSEWLRMKENKKQQRVMNNMLKLATSLTGALGTPLQRQVILPVGRSLARAAPSKQKPTQLQKKKGKEPALTSSQKTRLAIQAERQKKGDDASFTWWSEKLKELEAVPSVDERANMISRLFANKHTSDGWLATEFRLYDIHTELQLWIKHEGQEQLSVRDAFIVSIMRKVKQLFEYKELTKSVLDSLQTVLKAFGFSSYFPSFACNVTATDERKLCFKFVRLISSKSKSVVYPFMHITEDPVEWQLRLFGEYMDRTMDSKEDSRVAFKPDRWQRDVLDCVDANKSILVVAPTSAGKTFISFYAMEKVLRGSDDGILVYIAPTKALVNQVASEVYARFEKDVPGMNCWAIHTRDYRLNNPQRCQILVTVPEMFAIMLLSPPLARVWTPRVKTIILDEVHTIGQQEGGAVWEQILLLAPCPIIGLSATIGSPHIFNEWLEKVQHAHGFEHSFIFHPHRYSHLRKHIYNYMPNRAPFTGLSTTKHDNIRFLHPVATLTAGTQRIPSDFSLEANDCLSLYRTLSSFQPELPFSLSALEPTKFFSKAGLLRQEDVIRYETELKRIVTNLLSIVEGKSEDSLLTKVIDCLQDRELAKVPTAKLNLAPSGDLFLNSLITLLCEMHSKNALPAILFSFDRSNCEIMAQQIIEDLYTAEEEWRARDAGWKAKIRQWEDWKVRNEAKQKAQSRIKKKRDTDDDLRDRQEASSSWESVFDPTEPSSQFTFANHRRYSRMELEEDIDELKWSAKSTPAWVYKCLIRGIGIHHAGMNKGYRSLIERLFRIGFLTVIFATGTLALGINAPAKSAVFCGDSPFLTALQYRQCAGRAGRRGFDLLGNVIFYGLPMHRVQRLILSRLPILTGNFPLTSTLCLRLFNLLHGSHNAEIAVQAIQSLMKLPQISFGSAAGKEQLAHHLRFSIDYLRRAGLLDVEGRPMNLYGVAAHVYYAEPSNLAMVALLRSGVLHKICGQSNSDRAKRDIVLVLSHLFGRRYLPQVFGSYANVKKIRLESKTPSLIALPPLPPAVSDVLEHHNEEILQVFSSYARLYVSQYKAALGADHTLPFSKTQVGPPDESTLEDCLLKDHLTASAIKTSTRSIFVANSGHTDDVNSVEELARTCRGGLELNEHAIPSLSHITAQHGDDEGIKLNAYLFDFYVHGQVEALVAANGIRRGEVWFLLEEFDLTLKSIRVGLQRLLVKAGTSGHTGDVDDDEEQEDLVTLGSWDDDDTLVESVKHGHANNNVKPNGPLDSDDTVIGLSEMSASGVARPRKASDADWAVFKLFDDITVEFGEKFRKMWA